MLAARNGQPAGDQGAASRPARTSTRRRHLRGTTALMWAAEQKHPEAVKALLEGGADSAAQIGRRRPAAQLHGAARERRRRQAARRSATPRRRRRTHLRGAAGRRGSQARPRAARQSPAGVSAAAGDAGSRARRHPPAAAPQVSGGRGRRPQRPPRRHGRPHRLPAAPQRADQTTNDDTEVVVAGLVGSGGGGLTALVFAAREGDLESAEDCCSTPAPTSIRPPSTAGRRC